MQRAEDVWRISAVAFAVLFVGTVLVRLVDRRSLDGDSVWNKPLKFEVSLAVYSLTLAVVASRLSVARDSAVLMWTAVATTASAWFEIVYIWLQAARGVRSHFNVGTPFTAAMYVAMAVGAVIITVGAGIVGVVVFNDGGVHMGPGTRIATGLGLTVGAVLTLVTAFRIGGAMTHFVGEEPADARRMPITGWSLSIGDRRVAHFFATHMMQALPVLGLVLDAFVAGTLAVGGVVIGATGWVWVVLRTFRRAGEGKPL